MFLLKLLSSQNSGSKVWFKLVWTFCCRLTGEQLQEDDRLRQEVIDLNIFREYFWKLSKCFLPKYSNDLLLQNQVDRLAQDFTLASKEESLDAIDIGEKMLELMDRWGFMLLMMTTILYNDKQFELMTMMIFTVDVTTTSTSTIQEQTMMTFWQVGVQSQCNLAWLPQTDRASPQGEQTLFLWLSWTSSQAGQVSKAQKFAEVSYHLVCLAKGKNSLDAQKVASLR